MSYVTTFLDLVLAGFSRQVKSSLSGGIYTPHNISEPPYEEVTLLTAAFATSAWFDWSGGQGLWEAWGDFDGESAQLQKSPDGGTTPIDIDGAVLTTNGGRLLTLPADKIRVKLLGTGGSLTSISSKMKQC